ncbi:unnamed protein product [Effrenium voratum]|uniref:Uncharacterized protein n=1 Tax=Effrenium voratum TaxID=2562239 RepID=A0AA36J6B4_9DINO|nr:unnamed protein product [Effrenium voratum]
MTTWEVVGGADKGGIIVREDVGLSSAACAERLATGAKVKELEWKEGRLCYELVSGVGPQKGWVTTSLKGKELLVKSKDVSDASTSEGESTSEEEKVPDVAEKGPSPEEKEALQQYMDKFGENRTGGNPGYMRKAFPWAVGRPSGTTPKEAIEAVLKAKRAPKLLRAQVKLAEVDSDGEEVPLCTRCQLPVGEHAYEGRQGKGSCVHGECMAQVLVEDAQKQEDRRMSYEAEKKLKSRKEFEIGWRLDSVPKNASFAQRMGCTELAPEGLCCLVLDEASKTVKVAPTLEPAAAVNLEYLLLALKVRKTASREPLFSLDPVDPQNLEKTPQKKVYEPEWLAGTSVGDVMFQADYFLKELALGEYTMPVAGMMSVFDWSEMQNVDRAWAGREWFVVRKAEVRIAEDRTLVPFVKMGVEAREQMVTKKGLEDAAVTSPNHPLKKFADAFTRNFDLIAERKSVVFHLRELAKASVMAKYLVDSNARLDESWLQLAEEVVKGTPQEAHPEIPQLWNMRGNSRIQLKNGRVIDMFTGGQRNLHAIYGGVQFGLDRFELAQRHALQGQAGMPLASGKPMFMPQRFQLGTRPEMPQGVDLNLDKFDLSRVDRFERLPACSGKPGSLEAKVTLGRVFLEALRSGFGQLKQEHREMLQKIFSSPECDRTQEGQSFMPPDPNAEYTMRLQSLVNDEKLLFDRRKMYFFDKGFKAGDAGSEFPRSWTSRFQIEKDGRAPVSNKAGLFKVDVDEAFSESLLSDVLPTAAPEFNQKTEDGSTFRIYKIGSLEVRTVQEQGKPEQVGVVFSSRAPTWDLKSKKVELKDEEKLQQCQVYIEAAEGEGARQPCHYYMVFQASNKTLVVTEKLSTGQTTWAVNPQNLEDRNSLAKLLFTASVDSTVRDLRNLQVSFNREQPGGASLSTRKQYMKAVFQRMCGRNFRGKWGGFVRKYNGPAVPSERLLASQKNTSMWTAQGHELLGKTFLKQSKVTF